MSTQWLGTILAGMGLVAGLGPAASAADAAPRRLYDMSTETGMPHLDENLRYAVRRERRCLSTQDLSSVFWMLQDVSLQDCTLEKATDDAYRLECSGGHGTTGDARWQLGADRLVGTLNVRLGGKNMTFYPRITATPVGDCH